MNVKAGGALWEHHPHVRSAGQLTFGERAADVMRNAFGSWAFVGGFLGFMAVWMVVNTAVLGPHGWDKYPYILLNLSLSMMAGLQGALILIAAKRADRVAAEQATAHYSETSKIDGMAAEVLALQNQQLEVLSQQTDMLNGIEHLAAKVDLVIRAVTPPAAPVTAAGLSPAVGGGAKGEGAAARRPATRKPKEGRP